MKLPEWDPLKATTESNQKSLRELKSQVASAYRKLLDSPDKWKEYKNRYYLYGYVEGKILGQDG